MAKISTYLEQVLLNMTLRGVAYTPPAQVFLALHTTAPEDDDSGMEVSTVGTGYERKAITFDAATNALEGGSKCPNNIAVTYGPALSSWNVTHVGIYDASVDGNLLYWGVLPALNTINETDEATVKVGELSVRLD